MVEAEEVKLEAATPLGQDDWGKLELDDGDDIPIQLEEDQEEEEIFNPQEVDFDEVERLRGKVALLESVLANSAKKEPGILL